MKLKIGTKIVMGFSVVLILLAILSAVSIISTKSIGKDVKTIEAVNERLSLQKEIEIHFYSSVAGIRGYIAYGSDKFKDTYNTEMSQVLELEKRLMEITTEDKKAEVQRLVEVTGTYDKGITNELMPAIQKQFQATNPAVSTAAKQEVLRIAGTLTPVTGQLTEILRGLVDSDEKVFKGGIESTGANVANVVSTSLVLGIVAFIFGLVLSLFIARSIKNPIMQMVKGANKFADGDFTGEINVKSSDEVGDLANSLNTMAARLRSLIADVITNAQTLAAHSQELAGSAQEVSATIEEVASTTNEVAAMAERSMENANQTAAESNKAVAVAEKGGKTVGQTVEKINFISKSTSRVQESVQNLGDLSAKIGNITKIITGIADQTNLLALNAAIEAARAGDQGRGFAVVAEEVRKLAEQSASAAGEIGQLINQIKAGVDTAIKAMEQGSSDVNEGVNLASEAGAALEAIIMAINNNITLVNEIALGAKQTSEGTQQLSASNEQVTSTIQQVAGATQELAQIANTLQSSVAQFKV